MVIQCPANEASILITRCQVGDIILASSNDLNNTTNVEGPCSSQLQKDMAALPPPYHMTRINRNPPKRSTKAPPKDQPFEEIPLTICIVRDNEDKLVHGIKSLTQEKEFECTRAFRFGYLWRVPCPLLAQDGSLLARYRFQATEAVPRSWKRD